MQLTSLSGLPRHRQRFDYVVQQWSRLAGGAKIGFSNATYLSERSAADRNYALAYFMRENHCFPLDAAKHLDQVLEFFFQCCSLEVTCDTLAVVAATLANGGVCPVTGQQVSCADAAGYAGC